MWGPGESLEDGKGRIDGGVVGTTPREVFRTWCEVKRLPLCSNPDVGPIEYVGLGPHHRGPRPSTLDEWKSNLIGRRGLL